MTTPINDSTSTREAAYLQHKNNLLVAENGVEKIKPFIALNLLSAQSQQRKPALTPASGQAIVTYVIAGAATYSDSTGKQGKLQKDGWAWEIAGAGIWHSIAPITRDYIAVQLCIALSPALENSPPQSAYLPAEPNAIDGDPAKLLIGWHGKNRSHFAIPSQLNFLVVPLKAEQLWSYELPLNHQFAWVAIISGLVTTSEGKTLPNGASIFYRPTARLDFHARTDAVMVLGSSIEFGHDLIFQDSSVHTSTEALQIGCDGISVARKALGT
jgi:redox-sensitive bicupin YhaK (pirin superfamily)